MRNIIIKNDNGDKVNGYFIFKINHKPIPEVSIEMNVSQLVAANKILEDKNKEKDETIALLQAQISELRTTLPLTPNLL